MCSYRILKEVINKKYIWGKIQSMAGWNQRMKVQKCMCPEGNCRDWAMSKWLQLSEPCVWAVIILELASFVAVFFEMEDTHNTWNHISWQCDTGKWALVQAASSGLTVSAKCEQSRKLIGEWRCILFIAMENPLLFPAIILYQFASL